MTRRNSNRLHGLYVITPDLSADHQGQQGIRRLEYKTRLALQGGAALLQFRDKCSSDDNKKELATRLKLLCHEYGAVFIINDDVELAKTVGADGVHLGKSDCSLHRAREFLGEQAIIGISCYNRLELAQQAEQAGADYVAFGRFFRSNTKPDAVVADTRLIQRAKQVLEIPVTAIGGITVQNASGLVQVGADMLAVIEGVFGHEDVKAAAQSLCGCFSEYGVNEGKLVDFN